MTRTLNWTQTAAENLSLGLSREETISTLKDSGLDHYKAANIVDSLLGNARQKGLKEIGLGSLVLLGSLFLVISLTDGFQNMGNTWQIELLIFIALIGVVFLSDGIRRLSSIWLVAQT